MGRARCVERRATAHLLCFVQRMSRTLSIVGQLPGSRPPGKLRELHGVLLYCGANTTRHCSMHRAVQRCGEQMYFIAAAAVVQWLTSSCTSIWRVVGIAIALLPILLISNTLLSRGGRRSATSMLGSLSRMRSPIQSPL